jgi:hypothetical protein
METQTGDPRSLKIRLYTRNWESQKNTKTLNPTPTNKIVPHPV